MSKSKNVTKQTSISDISSESVILAFLTETLMSSHSDARVCANSSEEEKWEMEPARRSSSASRRP